jgi:hypothetical protein
MPIEFSISTKKLMIKPKSSTRPGMRTLIAIRINNRNNPSPGPVNIEKLTIFVTKALI